jgi:hypothetical protein
LLAFTTRSCTPALRAASCKFIADETEKWSKVIKSANLKLE